MLAADPHGGADCHSHPSPMHRHWHVINPGSVGLPLDGQPMAQFAMIESVPEQVARGGWRVTHHAVAYDRRPALEAFHTHRHVGSRRRDLDAVLLGGGDGRTGDCPFLSLGVCQRQGSRTKKPSAMYLTTTCEPQAVMPMWPNAIR